MSDNTRLSSTQALEDYFVDLLLEPELEPEPELEAEPEIESRPEQETTPELDARSQEAELPADQGESSEQDAPRPGCRLPQNAGLLSACDEKPDQVLPQAVAVQLAENAIPAAKPFDFASMDNDTGSSSMPAPVLDNVQRLLNQVSKVRPQAETSAIDAELEDDWQQVMAHEQASAVEAEPELPPVEVTQPVEAITSEGMPPDNWSQQIHQGDEFQALFFEVNGVTFAVPLTELGGIHQLGEVNRLLGRPPWYLGLMSSREHQLDVVDTACWVMPDKLDGEEYREQYKYVVMLGESKWGLACNTLLGTETLSEHSVRWREKAGKRPWLAGMVKEKMCALIHVSELISMLKAGLDVNTKLRQS